MPEETIPALRLAPKKRPRFMVRALTWKHLNHIFPLVSCRVYLSTKRKEKNEKNYRLPLRRSHGHVCLRLCGTKRSGRWHLRNIIYRCFRRRRRDEQRWIQQDGHRHVKGRLWSRLG